MVVYLPIQTLDYCLQDPDFVPHDILKCALTLLLVNITLFHFDSVGEMPCTPENSFGAKSGPWNHY